MCHGKSFLTVVLFFRQPKFSTPIKLESLILLTHQQLVHYFINMQKRNLRIKFEQLEIKVLPLHQLIDLLGMSRTVNFGGF